MKDNSKSEYNLRLRLLALPRLFKRAIVVTVDIALVIISVWLAYFLRVGSFLPLTEQTAEHFPLPAILVGALISIPIFMAFGLYRMVFRYVDRAVLFAISKAVLVYACIYILIFSVIGVAGVPRTIGFIQPTVLFGLVCSARFFGRLWLRGENTSNQRKAGQKKVLIYGAGYAGRQVARLLSDSHNTSAVGFLDDDPVLQGQKVSGLPVFAPDNLSDVVSALAADEILLAIPGVGRRRRYEILETLRGKSVMVRTLPSYDDLIQGKIAINDIRDLSIDEILGREIILAKPELMRRDITQRVVLVTGAGGSIGSELCKQIVRQKPRTLVLFEQSEYALYHIKEELLKVQSAQDVGSTPDIVAVLGSVTDERVLRSTLKNHAVETIYHAAAYKHVPLVEENPIEGVRNNLIGTLVLAQVAQALAVTKFVLISTDKAVRPTSMMGASKRVAEIILQVMSKQKSPTVYAIVRFGNVLESSGSVVPLFKRQIKDGGPVTVTHLDVERYFMTVSEAAQLVIQAGAMTEIAKSQPASAPVYLLDMGDPVKIMHLAREMIERSGLTIFDKESNPNGDIEINITGLRPGEKLFEELLIGYAVSNTLHPKIHVAEEIYWLEEDLEHFLGTVKSSIENSDVDLLKSAFKQNFDTLS